MKYNNNQETARSGNANVGMIVRLSLALLALAGSAVLAWTLISAHGGVHAASPVNTLSTSANPWQIVFDSSGNAWVAEPDCNAAPVCGTSPAGAIQEFHLSGGKPTLMNTYSPGTGQLFNPVSLQLDGAGHAWFTDPTHNAIGELTIASTTWTEFTTGITANGQPFGLILDKNSNLWFTERGAPVGNPPASGTGNLGKIAFFNTTTHLVVETAVSNVASQPDGMTYNSTANTIWFAEDNAAKIGSFTPTISGAITITEHVSNANPGAPNPHLVTLDGSGNVWYSEQGSDLIGEYNVTNGTTKQFSAAGSICPTPGVTPTPCTNTYINGIAVDSTGTVWFDETQTAQLGSLNPTTSAINLYPLGTGTGPGDGLAVDASNNVWVSLFYGKQIGELPSGSSPTPTPSVGSGSPSPTPTGTPPPGLQAGPVSKTWYFAEGRVGAGFTEYLSLDNPTPNPCTVKITYLYTPDRGTPTTKTVSVSVPANTRYEEGVDGDLGTSPGGRGVSDSAIVSVDGQTTPSCAGIVAERPMYFTSQGNGLGANSTSDVLGVTHLGTTFYLADVATGPQNGGLYNSFLTILNPPGAPSANVTATYYVNGLVVGTDSVSVAGGTRGTIWTNRHVPALPAHVAVVMTSTQPVVVERPTYFSHVSEGNAGVVSGGADVIAVQSLATDWLFAEGYTGGQFQEQFVIANLDPNSTGAAAVTIKLEPQNGTAPSSYTVSVPHLGQVIWDVNQHLPGQALSAEITSSGPQIAVDREMFFRYNHQGNGRSLQATGGSDALGQVGPAAQSLYSFAEGYVNVNYDEWLTLQNPTGSSETIWVTLDNALGHTLTFSINVGGNSRATIDIVHMVLTGLYHNGDGFRGLEVSMTVQTTSTAGGPFVAERPMYSNVGGIQGGTDIIGYTGG